MPVSWPEVRLSPRPGNESSAARNTATPSRTVFTAGYEGESIDQFLEKLAKAGIRRVIDVRNNPVSRKHGFSKAAFSRLCGQRRIDYVHLPALGIPSRQRRNLKTADDFQRLLAHYEQSILPAAEQAKAVAIQCLREKTSVLVCFEADPAACHRTRLAKAIAKDAGCEIHHL
jgi:uncharacterized protein (DUF488 family)